MHFHFLILAVLGKTLHFRGSLCSNRTEIDTHILIVQGQGILAALGSRGWRWYQAEGKSMPLAWPGLWADHIGRRSFPRRPVILHHSPPRCGGGSQHHSSPSYMTTTRRSAARSVSDPFFNVLKMLSLKGSVRISITFSLFRDLTSRQKHVSQVFFFVFLLFHPDGDVASVFLKLNYSLLLWNIAFHDPCLQHRLFLPCSKTP